MNPTEKFKDFLVRKPDSVIRDFEASELELNLPIIGRGVQDLLRMLMINANPRYILEIGTCSAFSTVLMARYAKNLKEIVTIEYNENNYKRAVSNIEKYGYSDRILPVFGDATKVLKEDSSLNREYDFIFIDCAKAQYKNVWDIVRNMVRPGGIVVTDDILQDKSILSSRFLLNRRDRTVHKRMREFLYAQLNDEDFSSAVFEIDDGVSISTKNEKA